MYFLKGGQFLTFLTLTNIFISSLLIYSANLTLNNYRNLKDSQTWVTHTREVINNINEIHKAVLKCNLTSIKRTIFYTDEYRICVKQLYYLINQLKQITNDNKSQQKRINNLKIHVDSLVLYLNEPLIESTDYTDFLNRMDVLTNIVESFLDGIADEENKLLKVRRAKLYKYTDYTNIIILFNLFFSFFVLLGKYIVLVKEIDKRTSLQNELIMKKEALQERNYELQQFAYVASHDLQEPLRMVHNYLQLLQKRLAQLSIQDLKTDMYISHSISGAYKMKRLIDDILQYSQTGRKEFKIIDLNKVLQDILDIQSKKIKECGVNIEVSPLPIVKANYVQMEQIFSNLIANAIKFRSTDSQKPARILIGYTEGTEFYTFFVKDNGIGIEEEFYKKIFNLFERLHSEKDYAGTGIGLAICDKLVKNHEGIIWVDSVFGEGSTFYFTIKKNLNNYS